MIERDPKSKLKYIEKPPDKFQNNTYPGFRIGFCVLLRFPQAILKKGPNDTPK